MNYELRWLNRKTGRRAMNEHGYFYDETVRVLQYRAKYNKTIYAREGPDGDYLKEMTWSDWCDVPEVDEL